MRNQARGGKVSNWNETDLNDNDQGTKNGTTKQIYRADIPPKGNHSNRKRKAQLPSGGAGKSILWLETDGKEI